MGIPGQIGAFTAAGIASGVVAHAASERLHAERERSSPSVAGANLLWSGPMAGVALLGASIVLRRIGSGTAPVVALAGAGAIAGGLAGWLHHGSKVKHRVESLPFDPHGYAALAAVSAIAEATHRLGLVSRPAGQPRPHTPGSWNIAFVADTGAATRSQERVIANIVASDPELVLHGGDMVQGYSTEAEWQRVVDPPQYMGGVLEDFEVRPVVGNHELLGEGGLAPFRERFPELDGQRWYSFQRDGVDFLMLDATSPMSEGSDQYRWLEQQLGSASGDTQVVVLHYPLASGLESAGGTRGLERIGALLDRGGVELVLAGHQHYYERSRPLNGHGTVQVVTGSGGHSAVPTLFRQPDWSATRVTAMGHVDIEVTPDALVGRYLLRDGSVADTWTVPRGAAQASTS